MKVTHDAIYNCDPQFYLEQYFDAEGRAERELKGCGTVSFKVIESSRGDDVWTHVAESTERVNAPGPVRKIFGETTRLEERATWRRSTNIIEVEAIPGTLKSKLTIHSQIRADAAGEGKTRITLTLDVKAKIFAVGGLIEKMAVKEMPAHVTKDAAYFNAHIAPK